MKKILTILILLSQNTLAASPSKPIKPYLKQMLKMECTATLSGSYADSKFATIIDEAVIDTDNEIGEFRSYLSLHKTPDMVKSETLGRCMDIKSDNETNPQQEDRDSDPKIKSSWFPGISFYSHDYVNGGQFRVQDRGIILKSVREQRNEKQRNYTIQIGDRTDNGPTIISKGKMSCKVVQ